MALVLKDRVRESSSTSGTGTITLAGAVTGFDSFASIGDGNTTYYAIIDALAGDWEVGLGTYTASGTTLSRDTVLESSNSDTLVNFAANSKDVICTYPADRSVFLSADGSLSLPGALSATGAVTGSNLNVSNWDTAYGWGDHASAGYYPTASMNLSGVNFSTILSGLPIGVSRFYTATGGSPNSSWAHSLTIKTGDSRGFQISMGHTEPGDLYFRNQASDGTAWATWRRVWTDTDFNSGDKTNWDTAYGWGDHASEAYYKASVFQDKTSLIISKVPDGIDLDSGLSSPTAGFQIMQDTAGADALMTFHVAGDFAGYFGIDGGLNDFVVGGWSYGSTTKYQLWHEGNDGSGSGLDADLLDGVHVTQVLRSDAYDEKTSGSLLFKDNVQLMFGNSGDAILKFNATHTFLNLVAGDFYVQDNGTSKFLFVGASGNFHADGDGYFFSTSVGSDRKLKDDIVAIDNPLEKIDLLNGVTFTWKKSGEGDAGLIAQDVEKVLPCAVKEIEELDGSGTRLNLNYNAVVGLLVEGLKEEKAARLLLEERLAKLEAL